MGRVGPQIYVFFGVANGKWQMVEIANKKKNMVGSVARGEHILYIFTYICNYMIYAYDISSIYAVYNILYISIYIEIPISLPLHLWWQGSHRARGEFQVRAPLPLRWATPWDSRVILAKTWDFNHQKSGPLSYLIIKHVDLIIKVNSQQLRLSMD